MSHEWAFVTQAEEMRSGHGAEFVVAGRVIAIYRIGDEFYALDGVCPHQGGPLGKGSLEGPIVTCPWHGWRFDVRDGTCLLSAAIRQPAIEIKVADGCVYIKSPPGSALQV